LRGGPAFAGNGVAKRSRLKTTIQFVAKLPNGISPNYLTKIRQITEWLDKSKEIRKNQRA